MIVAGLDLSMSCTGVCIKDRATNEVLHYFTSRTSKSPELDWFYDCLKRSLVIAKEIADVCIEYKVTHIIVESPSLGSKGSATRSMPMLIGVVLGYMRNHMPLRLLAIPPSTLKKRATGSGNASKKQMLDSVPEPYHSLFSKLAVAKGRYDLADAYHLASFTLSKE